MTKSKLLRRSLMPLVVLAALWGLFTRASLSSWVVGLPFIALAVFFHRRLSTLDESFIRIDRLPGFALWFLWHSLRGGLDVARRALHPKVQLAPGFLYYRLALPPGQARLFLVNIVSLLPGTLSADIEDSFLVLHTLDTTADPTAEVDDAERRVSALFGIATG